MDLFVLFIVFIFSPVLFLTFIDIFSKLVGGDGILDTSPHTMSVRGPRPKSRFE
jgi:hypothetical protein